MPTICLINLYPIHNTYTETHLPRAFTGFSTTDSVFTHLIADRLEWALTPSATKCAGKMDKWLADHLHVVWRESLELSTEYLINQLSLDVGALRFHWPNCCRAPLRLISLSPPEGRAALEAENSSDLRPSDYRRMISRFEAHLTQLKTISI